ncbi:superkiller viralicidic activity 2-like 2 isoform B [Chlorella sorokiniana]|uniref:Superkiller viralicidic activity 2-like 2 isoform B n=1 Tax=Chlorella sorokiniana TaxID=3076 RepID=A0A2P6TBJ4_CHLSO|nr:superkiller viralicidic activity 2-like 2 isoform B [Chlorella sorokiniana]|eukprot:PRW05917.1 superkiller viralicidic activity 2-like 2 isoform B [Chlorella sorokiniana]
MDAEQLLHSLGLSGTADPAALLTNLRKLPGVRQQGVLDNAAAVAAHLLSPAVGLTVQQAGQLLERCPYLCSWPAGQRAAVLFGELLAAGLTATAAAQCFVTYPPAANCTTLVSGLAELAAILAHNEDRDSSLGGPAAKVPAAQRTVAALLTQTPSAVLLVCKNAGYLQQRAAGLQQAGFSAAQVAALAWQRPELFTSDSAARLASLVSVVQQELGLPAEQVVSLAANKKPSWLSSSVATLQERAAALAQGFGQAAAAGMLLKSPEVPQCDSMVWQRNLCVMAACGVADPKAVLLRCPWLLPLDHVASEMMQRRLLLQHCTQLTAAQLYAQHPDWLRRRKVPDLAQRLQFVEHRGRDMRQLLTYLLYRSLKDFLPAMGASQAEWAAWAAANPPNACSLYCWAQQAAAEEAARLAAALPPELAHSPPGAALLARAKAMSPGQPPAKRAKLGGNGAASHSELAAPQGHVNLIEVDGKSCTHEVAWPPGEEGSPMPPPARPGPPARQYPFKIDPFQQTAVNALEAGHSVLVAAHTSAGKTVVAEYAFAMALRDGAKVVYTSPLKALSNQKYRELQEQFGDVGLMTGDVTINPNASCLVMTTEILRSMMYRGSEVVRQLSLVVYDEIHYLRDKERGVVWEESIILAPSSVRFAFLSATIPNAREFADWVAKIHGSPCHVVYTDYRPTPLEHYVFPAGGDGLFLAVDSKGTFRDDNFAKAVAQLQEAEVKAKAAASGGGGKGKKGGVKDLSQAKEESDILKIVRMVAARHYDPCIVFNFSKKECEALAHQMQGLDLNEDDEKKLVDGIFSSAVDCLSEEDRKLPQIGGILPMLRRGIGVHHSGLLPILKEVIEILFQEGLIKVLVATETFSTGLNMPAKTVVFTNVRKFDGGGFRWVRSGEYIQMSGRAGRRGLDDKGIVILMMDAKLEPAVAKDMMKGAPDTLYSEFHLTYSMLLNLLKVEGVDPESLMQRSYRQFQMERALPSLEARVAKLEAERDGIAIEQEEKVQEFLALSQQLEKLRGEVRAIVSAPKNCLPFLQPGRLVRVLPPEQPGEAAAAAAPAAAAAAAAATGGSGGSSGSSSSSSGVLGVVINFERAGKQQQGEGEDGSTGGKGGKGSKGQYIVDVLCNCSEDSLRHQSSKRRAVPVPLSTKGQPVVVPVALPELAALSSIRVYIPQDLRTPEARERCAKTLQEVERRFPKGLPLLDPEEDMKIEDEALRKLQRKLESLEGLLRQHSLARAADLRPRLEALLHKQALHEAARTAKKEVKAAQALIFHDDLKARKRVLGRLGYLDDQGVVTLKGRFASELSTGDELVLTEMIFAGVFKALRHDQLCALLSCFIWREKSEAGNKVRSDLEAPFAALREHARKVARTAVDCKMEIDADEYVESFRPDLMDVVAAWAQGTHFFDIYKMMELFEGSLVRAIRRLEELLRQLAAALRTVGNIEDAEHFENAIEKVKRGIVFAASLYL